MGQPLRIVNLEDDPLDTELVLALLRKDGLTTEIERVDTLSGFEEALSRDGYGLILADYLIPGMDALEALHLAAKLRPDVPFVFLSGMIGEDKAIELLKLGASDYVLKQRIERLAPAVRRALREAEERACRKQTECALRESETRYRNLFTTMSEGFALHELIFDADGKPCDYRFLEVNPAFERTTGLKAADVVGRTLREVLPDSEPVWLQRYSRVVLSGEPDHFEEYHRSSGRWYEVFASRAAPGHFTVVFLDITERKRALDALAAAKVSAEQAKTAAEQASRAKDHFLAVLSHELRTPLTPVLATVAMLQENHRLDGEVQRHLEVIRRNVALEARLIDDLLDVTRIVRGKVELDRRPVELGTIIRHAVEVCMPDIEARALHFGVDISDDPYPLEADAARLQQVFWNLLKNAIKFTPVGGCVGIRCRREGRDHVVAEVNDSGVGITPEVLPRIFRAFDQGEPGRTRQFGGLGLGLTISQAMVQMHGGNIEAHSQGAGQGATFRVRLPLSASPARFDAPEAQHRDAAVKPSLRSLRILLVEDHGDTAKIMKLLLKSDGHQVETAADVATALKLAGEQTFDLLVSDLGLPDGSGLDLMRSLRARGSSLVGIALSGYGLEDDIRQSRDAGFTTHLTKPADYKRLMEVIHSLVG